MPAGAGENSRMIQGMDGSAVFASAADRRR